MSADQIQGECEPRFSAVKKAFAENFEKRGEVGASVAITLDGKPVVDLWAGHADKAKTRPWTRDTVANVYSTTKGLTAMCAHRLVDQGKLASNQYKRVNVHWIEAEKQMRGLGVSSKLNARMDFLLHLKEIGRQVADQWIAAHFDAIGQRSTIDIKEKFL